MPQLFKAIVVDDEAPARRLLTGILREYDDFIELTGEAGSGAKAIELINSHRPDVIFLDIQLQDMTGFDVLKQLSRKPFVIFTTAYDEYAIKAFDELSIDYLLKPIKQDRMAKALDKLQQFSRPNATPALMSAFENMVGSLRSQKRVKTLSVKTGSKFILVQLDDVLYFEAYDKYTFIHTSGGEKLFCDYMLAVLEEKIPGDFIRVQKSYIINREKVFEIHKYSNNRFTLVLADKAMTRIVTGPSYFSVIKDTFGV